MTEYDGTLDPFSPTARRDPYPLYAELRRRGVYRLPDNTTFLASRYRDVRHVLLNSAIFSAQAAGEAMMRRTPEVLAILARNWQLRHPSS